MDISRQANCFLIVSGILNASAAILHLGCIYYGAPWYRFFGAGEEMAVLSEQGSIQPTIITSGIFLVLSIWSLYAFSAVGIITKLPFLKVILVLITCIYFLRGIAGFFFIHQPLGRSPEFWFWSSIVCLFYGVIHLIGLKQQWSLL